MQRRQIARGFRLVVALVLAGLSACSDSKDTKTAPPSQGPLGKGIYIGEDFALARAVTGHRVHVVAKKIECTKCHTPTETAMGPPVKPERCATCHEKEAKLAHATAEAEKRFGAGVKTDCTTCHAFKFDGKDHAEATRRAEALPPLTGTDAGAVDTDAGSLDIDAGAPWHGIETFSPGDCKHCHESKQGETAAVVAHLKQTCLTCHKPHEEQTPRSAPCSDCHEKISTAHASQGKTVTETCTTCHEHQHEPAKAALPTCIACHSKSEPIVPATALFADGHTECTTCHRPHEFQAAKVASCTGSCHALNVIGGARVPAHNTCTNCHSPHSVKASPAAACANCHKDVHSDHPKQAGSCVGCHSPHPAQVTAEVDAKSCSSCHQQAHSDKDFHRGVACEGCHKPHDFKLMLANVATCTTCHEKRVEQVALNAGHKTLCSNCHRGLPHHPEAAEVGCETCHGREHTAANAGHARCTQCHEPHSGAQATACGNCHKDEHRTAPQGHQACTNCHEPHGGVTQKQCTACHAPEVTSPHGQLSSGCLTCHRPHGPTGVATAPACTSCHKVAQLPGLHAETKHQTCTTCHSGHSDAKAMIRDTCVGCHKDRTKHFPDSQGCTNCHLFTKTR